MYIKAFVCMYNKCLVNGSCICAKFQFSRFKRTSEKSYTSDFSEAGTKYSSKSKARRNENVDKSSQPEAKMLAQGKGFDLYELHSSI